MKSYCDGMFNDLASSELLSEEKKIELWQGWQEGIAYLEKSRDIGSFIVLEAANEELKVLLYNLKALKYPEKEGPPWDMFIQQGQVISQTLATLRSIAKQDLGVK